MLKRTSLALIIATALSGSFAVLPVFAQDGQNMQDGMMSGSKMKDDMKDDKMKQPKMKDDKSKHRKKAKHRPSRKPKPAEKMSGDKM